MSDENALAVVNLDQLPSTQIGSDADFDSIAKSSDFLPRLQLFTKGKAVNRKLVGPGNYGIPISDDEVTDLNDEVDIIPLARRPKAIDLSDRENIVSSFDINDPEFKRIQEQAHVKESGCMYGPSFLIYERSTRQFLEFYCGTKSSRLEAKRLFPYLPITAAQAEAMRAKNPDSDVQAHGPLPVTLKSRLIEKGKWTWHVPVVVKCSTPFTNLPDDAAFVKTIAKFLDVKREGAAVVQDAPVTSDDPNARVR